jgi:hypothetical protein
MVSHQIGLAFFNLLPFSMSAPSREAARSCQLAPGQDCPAAAFEFIERSDLAEGENAEPNDLNVTMLRLRVQLVRAEGFLESLLSL